MLVLGNARVLFVAVPFVMGEVVITILILVRECGCMEIAVTIGQS